MREHERHAADAVDHALHDDLAPLRHADGQEVERGDRPPSAREAAEHARGHARDPLPRDAPLRRDRGPQARELDERQEHHGDAEHEVERLARERGDELARDEDGDHDRQQVAPMVARGRPGRPRAVAEHLEGVRGDRGDDEPGEGEARIEERRQPGDEHERQGEAHRPLHRAREERDEQREDPERGGERVHRPGLGGRMREGESGAVRTAGRPIRGRDYPRLGPDPGPRTMGRHTGVRGPGSSPGRGGSPGPQGFPEVEKPPHRPPLGIPRAETGSGPPRYASARSASASHSSSAAASAAWRSASISVALANFTGSRP